MKFLNRLKSLWLGVLLFPGLLMAQDRALRDTDGLTLEQCVAYALQNRAAVEQARLDEQIGDHQIKAKLSEWYPQISATYGGVKNLKLQQQPFGNELVTLGRNYNSNIQFQANQTLFSNDLLLASRASGYTRQRLELNTQDTRINTVVDVSKAFYDLLLTQEQVRILEENYARQEKQYKDARSRFEVGLVDKTDYQRAAITLGNIRSDRKRAQESVKAKQAYLKQLMGFPIEDELDLAYDYDTMQQAVLLDTTQLVDFTNRVELQQLRVQQQILQLNTSNSKWGFLPTVSAYVNYNSLYFNNEFAQLYNQSYPTSGVGLQVSLPIFQGTKRLQNLKIARLQEQRAEVEVENTRKVINTEYQTALANYKSNYFEWLTLRDNMQAAQEVYDIIRLQYDEGIKAYVDLIVAETDLRTTQLNYYNALFGVLASKLDYQRAIGETNINY
ncbi:TolC family protein [Pontibacter sp. E15-1]|uniref:TolC family protein n=1 Tax=Pontibacter sp. E15-1 TaxID=2919918 RepID=UPI001F50207C|nr:TolC family protein [Pontibacter sp. E15-1]MCJ8166293.1 TolC family protein [Pontibacter sp. E15-1]